MTTERSPRIEILNNKKILADSYQEAVSFRARFFGFMGVKKVPAGKGILFPRTNSVHMWWMRSALDIVFLKRSSANPNQFTVMKIFSSAKPGRALPFFVWDATDVLELGPGSIDRASLEVGNTLCIV